MVTLVSTAPATPAEVWAKISSAADLTMSAIQTQFFECEVTDNDLAFTQAGALRAEDIPDAVGNPAVQFTMLQKAIIARRGDEFGAVLVFNWDNKIPDKLTLSISRSIANEAWLEEQTGAFMGISILVSAVAVGAYLYEWSARITRGYIYLCLAMALIPGMIVGFVAKKVTGAYLTPRKSIEESEAFIKELERVVMESITDPATAWSKPPVIIPEKKAALKSTTPPERKPMPKSTAPAMRKPLPLIRRMPKKKP